MPDNLIIPKSFIPSNSVSRIVPGKTGAAAQTIPLTIEQNERLFTTRTRAINHQTGGGDRGQRTYIKLLTTDSSKSLDRHVNELGTAPTSLGSAESGPLADLIKGLNSHHGYADFLLTGIAGSLDEKLQITEVFGDAEVVYYFGKQPVQIQFQGMLIDSPDNAWFVQWIEMYGHVLRGTQLARNYELVKIVTPNMTFIGSVMRMAWDQNSDRDADVRFSFTFLAKEIIPSPVLSSGKPLSKDNVVDFAKAETFKTQSQITSLKTSLGKLQGVVKDPFSTVKDYAGAMNLPGPLGAIASGIGSSTLPSFGKIGSQMIGINQSTPGAAAPATGGGIFAGVTSNLAGIRASLFSPVYGVLSSLTKLIKGAGGNISSVVSSFTTPVRDILRDVRNISNQAIGVVNLINNTIKGVTNQVRSVDSDLRATLALLKKTGGVISSAPQTITSNLRDLVNAGKLPATTAFLQNRPGSLTSGSTRTTKIALLNSGKKHTPEQGAKL